MNFVPDQPSGSVSVSESTLHSQPMLEYTRAQVTGHAGIEDAPSDVGEDVDKEEAATWHDATVLCQAQRGGKSAAVQSVAGSVIASERSDRTGAIFGSGRRPHPFLKEAVIARRPQSDRRSNLTRYHSMAPVRVGFCHCEPAKLAKQSYPLSLPRRLLKWVSRPGSWERLLRPGGASQ